MKLYELTKAYQEVLNLAEENNTEAVKDTLDSIAAEIEVKAENINYVIKTMEGNTNAIDGEIKRLQALKERNTNAVENLKNYLFYNMRLQGKTEIKCPLFTARIQKNPPSVVITDETKVDAKYITVVTTQKIDKTAIKEDLKNGAVLPWARLEQGERLVLK